MPDLWPVVLLACFLAAPTAGCGREGDSSSSVELPPGSITGRERLGWDQQAPDAEELGQYTYSLYVDGVPASLPDAACGPLTGDVPTASCSSSLPPLRPGTHTLELATRISRRGFVLESARSAPLVVTVVGAGTASAVSQSARANSGRLRLADGAEVERVVGGLERPSALARLPDGRLLIAERGGRVRLAEAGVLRNASAIQPEEEAGGDLVEVNLAVAPDFKDSGHVYVGHVAHAADGTMVGRVARFRETGGTFGEAAVIVEGLPAEAGAPQVRFGPDGALYAATAADAGDTDDLGFYAGKILRLTKTGETAANNPIRNSPVFSFGYRRIVGIDWDPESGGLWTVEVQDGAVLLGRATPGGHLRSPFRLEGVRASDATFHRGGTPAGWRGSLFLASPDGECLYRVAGLSLTPPNPEVEPLFVGRFGRISAVMSAEDGLYFATANGGRDNAGRPTDAVYLVRDRTRAK